MEWMSYCGTALAFLGAALSVGCACAGSGLGVGYVGTAGAGILAEDSDRFSQILILQVIPGTQGLYGLVIWFFALMKMGFFAGGGIPELTITQGFQFFSACLPMAIGGLVTAAAQGKVAASSAAMCAKSPDQLSKGIIMCILVEFYAILCLLASFLMLNSMG